MYKYTIRTAKQVKKFLDRHPDIARRFLQKLDILCLDPFSNKLDIKKLWWSEENHYRLRIGKYRFLFTIDEGEILIYFYKAEGRGDVYQK